MPRICSSEKKKVFIKFPRNLEWWQDIIGINTKIVGGGKRGRENFVTEFQWGQNNSQCAVEVL